MHRLILALAVLLLSSPVLTEDAQIASLFVHADTGNRDEMTCGLS